MIHFAQNFDRPVCQGYYRMLLQKWKNYLRLHPHRLQLQSLLLQLRQVRPVPLLFLARASLSHSIIHSCTPTAIHRHNLTKSSRSRLNSLLSTHTTSLFEQILPPPNRKYLSSYQISSRRKKKEKKRKKRRISTSQDDEDADEAKAETEAEVDQEEEEDSSGPSKGKGKGTITNTARSMDKGKGKAKAPPQTASSSTPTYHGADDNDEDQEWESESTEDEESTWMGLLQVSIPLPTLAPPSPSL